MQRGKTERYSKCVHVGEKYASAAYEVLVVAVLVDIADEVVAHVVVAAMRVILMVVMVLVEVLMMLVVAAEGVVAVDGREMVLMVAVTEEVTEEVAARVVVMVVAEVVLTVAVEIVILMVMVVVLAGSDGTISWVYSISTK